MQVAGDDFRLDRQDATSDARSSRRGSGSVSRSSRSPIYCDTKASRPRVSVIVFLRSAPAASTLGPVGAEVDRLGHEAARAADEGGRAVEDRASPNRRRARRSARRARRSRSAIGARRRRASSSSAISGSPPRLALVATSARSLAHRARRRSRARRRARAGPASAAAYRRASRRPRRGRGATLGASAPRLRAQHDRPRRDSQQRALRLADLGEARRAGGVGHHHRERLGLARLAPAQARHRRFVARVADQVEAAEALERDDAALARGARRSSAISASSFGPQRGQAIGSAWKRRLAGSA